MKKIMMRISMEPRLLEWLRANTGKQFPSPRKLVFSRNPQDITIEVVREDLKQVHISFSEGKTQALPLHFWMFERALQYLNAHKEETLPIGAALKPPYIEGSIEGEIWREPRPLKNTYRVSPFILDLIVLAGYAEYKYTINADAGRKIQAAQYKLGSIILPPIKPPQPPNPQNPKETFLANNRETIEKWTEAHKQEIIKSRLNYRWQNKSRYDCERSRNKVSRAIIESRIRNGGAVDLNTLDLVVRWGFNKDYPDRDPEKALQITKEAFKHLENGNPKTATLTLMQKVKGVSISTASKIIGLYDQENLCIYDSRVGYALREMRKNGSRIILIPPSRDLEKEFDPASYSEWAENYERLIWTTEVIREYMNQQGCTYRLADVEMALFMMGK
jgi:hypothetical protein